MPDEQDTVVQPPPEPNGPTDAVDLDRADDEPLAEPSAPAERDRSRSAIVLGLAFVALGAFFLADEIWPDTVEWKYVWPVALMAIGVAVLVRARR